MGKYLDKFKRGIRKVDYKMKQAQIVKGSMDEDFPDEMPYDEEKEYESRDDDEFYDPYNDVSIQPAQKPESFHHFILENQYKDLEKSIRGYKDVYDKQTRQWETKRKDEHCFTDEESEDILRTAQSHLATDIKLGYISKEQFPLYMDALYKTISFIFYSYAEYRYGRYNKKGQNGEIIEDLDKQYKMKLQNHKIFLELWTRIQANYSRSIQGQENKYTHESVQGQESLQSSGMDDFDRRHRYT